eukprot:1027284-Pyramimonas_sp.AAC.1
MAPKWSVPEELWDTALNPGLGVPASKQTGGVGAPDIARPIFFFTKAVHLGLWRIRTSLHAPRAWQCSQASGLKKCDVEGPAGKRWVHLVPSVGKVWCC